jgi:hypothetical protein
MNGITIEQRLEDIHAHCFPDAVEIPNDAQARCEWYARRLLVIANAARTAMRQMKRQD